MIDGRSSNSLLLNLFASRRLRFTRLITAASGQARALFSASKGSTSVPKFGAREYMVPTSRALSDLEMIELQKRCLPHKKNCRHNYGVGHNMNQARVRFRMSLS
jgi:hypothetical protein